jgi:hypothetical protein
MDRLVLNIHRRGTNFDAASGGARRGWLCRELGITLIAYQPLASGALTGKYTVSNPPTGLRRQNAFFWKKNLEALRPVLTMMKEIGARYGKTPGQVALRWLIERGALPIPGAKNSGQAAHNTGALAGLGADCYEVGRAIGGLAGDLLNGAIPAPCASRTCCRRS